jgi:type II secretory pathway component PulF
MAATILASVVFLRSERGGRLRDQLLLKLPIIGNIVRKQAISRIALVMATLLRSDVEFLVALGIAAKSTTNLVIRDALESAGEAIQAGEDIASAFKSQSHAIPYTVIHLFSLGQQSGQLEELLEQLAENYDRQTETASTRFASILEPLLIVVLAVFVGFILFATLLPILEAGNVL